MSTDRRPEIAMSETDTAVVEDPTDAEDDEPDDRFKAVTARLDQQQAQIQSLIEERERDKDEKQELCQRVAELEEELEEERQKRKELEDSVEFTREWVISLDDVMSGSEYTLGAYADEKPPVLTQLAELSDGETLQDLREDVVAEQKTRSKQDTHLERKINELADELDVEMLNQKVSSGDKIQRLILNGPDAITDRVYPVHERAREVLLNAGDWGTRNNDQFGKRITMRSPVVREKLELSRNESLQSKQVRDVFEKIVEIAEDSPRKAHLGKTDNGVWRLRIHLQQEEM